MTSENEQPGGQFDKAPEDLTEGWDSSGPAVEDDTVGFGDKAVPTAEYEAQQADRIRIPTSPGNYAEGSVSGPLRTIILKSHRKLPSERQKADIEERESARIAGINVKIAEARESEITDEDRIPITAESLGFKGADPASHFNERTYVKEGELFYIVDKEAGGLTRVPNPSAELGELFTQLARLNRNAEGNDFIKLTPEELARL